MALCLLGIISHAAILDIALHELAQTDISHFFSAPVSKTIIHLFDKIDTPIFGVVTQITNEISNRMSAIRATARFIEAHHFINDIKMFFGHEIITLGNYPNQMVIPASHSRFDIRLLRDQYPVFFNAIRFSSLPHNGIMSGAC